MPICPVQYDHTNNLSLKDADQHDPGLPPVLKLVCIPPVPMKPKMLDIFCVRTSIMHDQSLGNVFFYDHCVQRCLALQGELL